MKTTATYLIATGVALAAVTVLACQTATEPLADAITFGKDGKGNGAWSGTHYSLNIIGVPNGKTADMTGNNGHRIFVALGEIPNGENDNGIVNTRIDLVKGETFQVIDANGTDTDHRASFQLPGPCPVDWQVSDVTCETEAVYGVWVRALGKPGGQSTTTTCMTDPTDGADVCSADILIRMRKTGRSEFKNADKKLLYVYADIGDGLQYYPLFHDALRDYYWSYDNQGLKLLQMRFYPYD